MTTAKQILDEGATWHDEKARLALPIMLLLAKSGRKLTYKALDGEITQKNSPMVVSYGCVLEKIGRLLNHLSKEWQETIPPLTILIFNAKTGEPSGGVDQFLRPYVLESVGVQLTNDNRRAMIELATNAVYNYGCWDKVAAYFGVDIPNGLTTLNAISLPKPSHPVVAGGGGEGTAHLELKEYVADHPELFVEFGEFGKGQPEYRLSSGDEVDVLFEDGEQLLAVEVKTAEAPAGELTRGIFQCVKYRAVLRAMCCVAGKLVHVQAVLVTPMLLPELHRQAAKRLDIPWREISVDSA